MYGLTFLFCFGGLPQRVVIDVGEEVSDRCHVAGGGAPLANLVLLVTSKSEVVAVQKEHSCLDFNSVPLLLQKHSINNDIRSTLRQNKF